MSVVLPAPFAPMSAVSSPQWMCRLTSCRLLIARRYAQVIDLDAAEPARRMAGAVHMRVTGVVMRNLGLNRFFLRHLESASVSTLAFSRMMVS